MKKIALFFMSISFLVTINPLLSNAEENKRSYYEIEQNVEVTHMLIGLISSKVDEQIKEKYNKYLIWNLGEIENIKSFGDAHGKTWYEVDMVVLVGDPEEAKTEKIKIKVDAPAVVNHETP